MSETLEATEPTPMTREQAIRWLLAAAQEALPYMTQEGRWALRTKGLYSDIGAARNLTAAIEAMQHTEEP